MPQRAGFAGATALAVATGAIIAVMPVAAVLAPSMPRPAIGAATARSGPATRRLAAGLLVALLSGCASVPVPAPSPGPRDLGRVAIVAADDPPRVEFQGMVGGKVEGAMVQGGAMLVGCMASFAAPGCTGPLCPMALAFGAALCSVLALGSGVAGAAMAEPASQVQAAESQITRQLQSQALQQSLRDAVAVTAARYGVAVGAPEDAAVRTAARAHDYRGLAALGVDTVVETSLVRVGTEGGSFGATAMATMQAQVRRVRTTDNAELSRTRFVWEGPRLKLAAWAADEAQALSRALRDGFETVGTQVAETTFATHPLPSRKPHVSGLLVVSFGLAAVDPPMRVPSAGEPLMPERLEWPRVASLRPRLAWQAFPRRDDVEAAPAEMARVHHVRYDLVIARERHLAPGETVLRREGLPAPAFTLDVDLEPATHYYWSVRARFLLDGREWVTEWARLGPQPLEVRTAPSPQSYRFSTPP